MEETKIKTPSKKAATRARLMQERAKRAAEREARERANITDLTEYFVQAERHDEVDGWLRGQIDKAKAEAKERRLRHRVAAGLALQAMLDRGEKISAVAEQAEITMAKVRTYLSVAADAGAQNNADTTKTAPKTGITSSSDAVGAPTA